MNEKYTSINNHKVDGDVLFCIKKHLIKHYNIRNNQIKIEYIINFSKKKPVLMKPLPKIEIANIATKNYIRIPDITVLDEDGKIWFAIEQDGKIHDSEPVIQKDKRRNQQYKEKNIPLIVLNTRKQRSEEKAWYVDLREQMINLGIAKRQSL